MSQSPSNRHELNTVRGHLSLTQDGVMISSFIAASALGTTVGGSSFRFAAA